MDHVVNQAILFTCLVVAGLGIALALPRKGVNPQVIGAALAGLAFAGLFALLGFTAYDRAEPIPSPFFYLFALLALGSALRVITHHKPVYAALYFILTVLSSSALFLLLSAEFMAFALIIIYAGAILITYLFVIMLATQAPSQENLDAIPDYDAVAREPLVATFAGVTLMVLISFMLSAGVTSLSPNADAANATTLKDLPRKITRDLNDRGLLRALEKPSIESLVSGQTLDLDTRTLTLTVKDTEAFADALKNPRAADLFVGEAGGIEAQAALDAFAASPAGATVVATLPPDLVVTNAEGVGFDLIAAHPMALEVAGVILLMAMVGAVVLARRQIELTEDEKAARARTLEQGGAA